VSGAITYLASIHTIGYTVAFALPPGIPLGAWLAFAFGLGATLVAFVVHGIALWLFPCRVIPALASFIAVVVAALAVEGLLPTGGNALAAWLIGVLLASAVVRRLRPNNSFKPNPLRGSA
jgi:hypothetical protein